MQWIWTLSLIFGSLIALMTTGLPVAICFLVIDIFASFVLWGGSAGLTQLIFGVEQSVSTFPLVAVPLFIFMGEIMFHSGVAPNMLDAMDKWLGRLPGRLALLAVGGGTVFATLTGSSIGSIAVLGAVLVPSMEQRGYKKAMSLGPIMGSGGLAILIPPSSLAIVLGVLGEISIGRILIAIIVPGLLLASIYAIYIILRCWRQPSLAPVYDLPPIPFKDKLIATVKYILPIGFIIFLVIGLMLLGVVTPSEAAAAGALGTIILAAAYRKLNWVVAKKSISTTIQVTVMIFTIIAAAMVFSQILAYSRASRGLIDFAVGLSVSPIFIVLIMQAILFVLGMFMETISIMLVTAPIFVPIVLSFHLDPAWFAALYLLNMEMAAISPPFGLGLYVMKSVSPPGTTMGDVYAAAWPFVGCGVVTLLLVLLFPRLALWLPSLMH